MLRKAKGVKISIAPNRTDRSKVNWLMPIVTKCSTTIRTFFIQIDEFVSYRTGDMTVAVGTLIFCHACTEL